MGEEIPASSNVVVAVAGSGEAYVVADSFGVDLDKAPGEWRSRQAFPADRDEIAAVRFQRDEQTVSLVREGESFRLVEPVADEANAEKVDELLDAIADLEIESFRDPPVDFAALGLDQGARSVWVTLNGEEEPIEIRLGETVAEGDGTILSLVDGQAFETVTDLPELIEAEVDTWQSTAWSRLEAYEVDVIEVAGEDGDVRLERAAGDWRRDGAKIAYTTASDLLYALRDVTPIEVRSRDDLDASATPLLEVKLESGENSEILALRPTSDGAFFAERQGREYALILDRGAVDEILEKLEAVRSAEPLPEVED